MVGRPKAKIQKLAVYFAISAILKADNGVDAASSEALYLPSLKPVPLNLLQPLAADPALAGATLRLSTPVSTRAAALAVSPAARGATPLRIGAKHLFRAAPALLWRLRFTSIPEASVHDFVILSIDFEVTSFANSDVSIDSVDLELFSGRVESLGTFLPRRCRPGDQITLLFKLSAEKGIPMPFASEKLERDLGIQIAATVLISEDCNASISIKWNTKIDLTSARPQSRSGPVYHLSKTMADGMLGPRENSRQIDPDSLIMANSSVEPESTTAVAAGVSLTITGPKEVVVGKQFEWSLFAINRSDLIQRLGIVTIPKRRKLENSREAVPANKGVDDPEDEAVNREAIMSDEDLYLTQRKSLLEPTELICLSPDIRIG